IPEIGDGDASTVEDEVAAGSCADLLKRAVTVVAQVSIALPAVPRTRAEPLRIEECPGLVLLLPGHDVVEELGLQLGAALVVHPAVSHIQVQPSVIVEIAK